MKQINFINKILFMALLAFMLSCQEKKSETTEARMNSRTVSGDPQSKAVAAREGASEFEPLSTLKKGSGETVEEAKKTAIHQAEGLSLFCDGSNYAEYIHDQKKTEELIEATGQGCQLSGYDFAGQDLTEAIFKNADISKADFSDSQIKKADFSKVKAREAIFKNANVSYSVFNYSVLSSADFEGANVIRTKFVRADLRGANFKNTDYQRAYYNEALLEGMIYDDYDWIVAYIRKFSGQGIRDPEGKGMILAPDDEMPATTTASDQPAVDPVENPPLEREEDLAGMEEPEAS